MVEIGKPKVGVANTLMVAAVSIKIVEGGVGRSSKWRRNPKKRTNARELTRHSRSPGHWRPKFPVSLQNNGGKERIWE